MRKRLKKKLINFSPSFWSWIRKNDKRDQKEARFVTMPFYCSNSVTYSMHSFYLKKEYYLKFKKKFRSKNRAVKYAVAARGRNIRWEVPSNDDDYTRYRKYEYCGHQR